MKQTTIGEATNPYERAFLIQGQIAVLGMEISEKEGKRARLMDSLQAAIADGEKTGKAKIGTFSLIVERKTREDRTIILKEIKEKMPGIFQTHGKLPANMYTKYMTKKQLAKLIADKNYDKEYKITLGELDKATGSKENSAPFVDVTVKETVKKSISMVRQPIIEV